MTTQSTTHENREVLDPVEEQPNTLTPQQQLNVEAVHFVRLAMDRWQHLGTAYQRPLDLALNAIEAALRAERSEQ